MSIHWILTSNSGLSHSLAMFTSQPAGETTVKPGCCSHKKPLCLLLSIVVLMFLWTCISSPLIVSVTGTGEVTAPVESAIITFSLTSNSDSASQAMSQVNSQAERVRGLLKSKGIADSDISSAQVTVVPLAMVTGGSGYQGTISMGVQNVSTSDINSLVDSLYGLGVTYVAQPVLSTSNRERLEQQAFDEAIKDAKDQANRVAKKQWKLIKKMVLVTQTTAPTTSTITSKPEMIEGQEGQFVDLLGGDVFKVTKQVTVSYKMW